VSPGPPPSGIDIKPLLDRHFGLRPTSIRPGERGYVSETWVVETAGEMYFAKLIPISRYSANIVAALPVQKELHDGGLREMSYPIPTRNGALSATLENHILVVNNFIDAEWTFDYQFEPFVGLIARLHHAVVRSPVEPETFEDPTLPTFEPQLSELLDGRYDNPSQLELQREVASIRVDLDGLLARFRPLIAEIRASVPPPMVVTHRDAPGNVLKDAAGRIYLVDWDDVMLAPRERDTWFHLTTPADRSRFLPLYRRTFPDYEVDERMYAYYMLARYFEDIEGHIERALSRETNDEGKAEALGYFRSDRAWLEEPIRALV
jgi:spectinomycin phosphotransferase